MRDEEQPANKDEQEPDALADFNDDLDVMSALAAVTSIDEIAAAADEDTEEPEALEVSVEDDVDEPPLASDVEIAPVAVEADEPVVDAVYSEYNVEPLPDVAIAHPPVQHLYRGQLASIVPAFLLIALGIVLTLQFTAVDMGLTLNLLLPIIIMVLGGLLWLQWFSGGRWARGNFFVGGVLLGIGAVGLYLVQPDSPAIATVWPLFVGVVGVAMMLTQLVGGAFDGRAFIIGLLLLVGGGFGFASLIGLLPTDLVLLLQTAWPLAIALFVFILLVAAIRSRL